MQAPLRIVWLLHERDRALRAHVVLGDDLGVTAANGQITWFKAAPVVAKRSGAALMLRYESGAETIGFCLPADAGVTAQVERARRAALPNVAARKWGPLLGKFSYLVEEAEPQVELIAIVAQGFTLARRAAHPDPLVDRFLLRDRAWHAATLDSPDDRTTLRERKL